MSVESEKVLLRCIDVTKRYGNLEVLHEVSLDVRAGQVVCVLGPSGSGKSTLLRGINHLEKIDGGAILFDGRLVGYEERNGKLHELKERQYMRTRSRMGMVFQNFNLFPHLTAVENITLAPRLVRRADSAAATANAVRLLDRVGLADKANSYPRQLSGGQQQRVAIARSLAMNPDLMLFDEPTSALDPELVQEVLDVMRALADDGMTMLVVTHEIGFAREVADEIVFMADGAIVEQGDPDTMLTRPSNPRTREFLAKVMS